jgi:hypothetical protein
VGAALGLNIASSVSEASIANGLTITAGGAVELRAENNMDATAIGDGSAALGKDTTDGTTVGIGIAINIADMQNRAVVGAGAEITGQSFKAEALMKKVDGDETHKFGATAISGASGGDTGVAGSFALNYSQANTEAVISGTTFDEGTGAVVLPGATLNAGTGNVELTAVNSTDAQVLATANAAAGGTGVGISVGINLALDNDTRAVIEDGVTINGGADVTLSATGSHKVNTVTEGGGKAADGTGVGGSLAITVADNVTEARVGGTIASTPLTITGAFKAQADHHGSSITTA